MPTTIRELTADDLPAAWQLGRLAFGGPLEPPPEALRTTSGTTRLGAFDDAGRLLGKVTDLAHEQWWAGAGCRRPTSAVSRCGRRPGAAGRPGSC